MSPTKLKSVETVFFSSPIAGQTLGTLWVLRRHQPLLQPPTLRSLLPGSVCGLPNMEAAQPYHSESAKCVHSLPPSLGLSLEISRGRSPQNNSSIHGSQRKPPGRPPTFQGLSSTSPTKVSSMGER